MNPNHVLVILSQLIDWKDLEEEFSNLFVEKEGAPAKPVRLITGLFMLQNMTDFSDEGAVQQWVGAHIGNFFVVTIIFNGNFLLIHRLYLDGENV